MGNVPSNPNCLKIFCFCFATFSPNFCSPMEHLLHLRVHNLLPVQLTPTCEEDVYTLLWTNFCRCRVREWRVRLLVFWVLCLARKKQSHFDDLHGQFEEVCWRLVLSSLNVGNWQGSVLLSPELFLFQICIHTGLCICTLGGFGHIWQFLLGTLVCGSMWLVSCQSK